MRGRTGKRRRRLERRKTLYDAVEPTLGPEVVKTVVGTSVTIRKMSDRILWKYRPPP
jgi:hypothetical protein